MKKWHNKSVMHKYIMHLTEYCFEVCHLQISNTLQFVSKNMEIALAIYQYMVDFSWAKTLKDLFCYMHSIDISWVKTDTSSQLLYWFCSPFLPISRLPGQQRRLQWPSARDLCAEGESHWPRYNPGATKSPELYAAAEVNFGPGANAASHWGGGCDHPRLRRQSVHLGRWPWSEYPGEYSGRSQQKSEKIRSWSGG